MAIVFKYVIIVKTVHLYATLVGARAKFEREPNLENDYIRFCRSLPSKIEIELNTSKDMVYGDLLACCNRYSLSSFVLSRSYGVPHPAKGITIAVALSSPPRS